MLLIKISKKGKITNIEKDNIDFIKKNKHISKLNTWDYNDNKLVLYGCENGNAGKENKYELPPPVDCELYFHDLYFVKYVNNVIVDFSVQEYNIFYNECFCGFENIEDTDDEEEESLSEHTSDREFINDDEISICSGTNELDLSEMSDFTSDDVKNTSDEDFDIKLDDEEKEEIEELSSIEITVSSCDDMTDDDDDDDDDDSVDTE